MAYIHIPFCKQRCKYCSFVSYPCFSEDIVKSYVDALLEEIKHFYKGETVCTLYFGGGTPSLLGVSDFERIIKSFKLAQNAEITVELNPESTKEELLKGLYELGVNRVSLGVQSFNDDILKNIGRLHDVKQAKDALRLVKSAGFNNVSIDLMYGLPAQNMKDWEKTLDEATKLDVEHISLYGLKIEEGSYFYDNQPENLPDADIQADMYLLAIEKLKDFEHYEISNFARNGKHKSRHNLGYWSLTPYYGFGVGASGYLKGKRYTNAGDLKEYLKNPAREKEFENTNALEEEIFLGFRKTEGIDTGRIREKYGVDFEKKYAKVLEKYPLHISKTQKGYRLTTEGILLSNIVLSDFL